MEANGFPSTPLVCGFTGRLSGQLDRRLASPGRTRAGCRGAGPTFGRPSSHGAARGRRPASEGAPLPRRPGRLLDPRRGPRRHRADGGEAGAERAARPRLLQPQEGGADQPPEAGLCAPTARASGDLTGSTRIGRASDRGTRSPPDCRRGRDQPPGPRRLPREWPCSPHARRAVLPERGSSRTAMLHADRTRSGCRDLDSPQRAPERAQ